ncbi:hypothetical protein ACFL19_00750 [Pseudomonadota bacterium]
MSKFKRGETSKNVLDKKNAITKSILLKSELLGRIKCCDNIPGSLERKGETISQGAVHKWEDDELEIISYSRNSAHSDHNSYALKTLLKAIKSVNQRLIDSNFADKNNNDGKRPAHTSDNTYNELRKENEELRVALAEVYRAYMQLIDKHREDKQIDEAYRKMILDQARILGRHRVRTIK